MLPDLTGKTVLIVGNAPGMGRELVAALRDVDYTIAVNRGVVHAPDANAMVSIDGNWPDVAANFKGLRLVGVPVDDPTATFAHMPHEVVTLGPGNVVHIRNNTLSAMRIAAKAGAKSIVLYGFDPEAYEAKHSFRGFVEGLAALTAELVETGVAVERRAIRAKPLPAKGRASESE